jgi:hypothetical protein
MNNEFKNIYLDFTLPNGTEVCNAEFIVVIAWVDHGFGEYEFAGATGVHESYSPYLVSSEYFGQEYIEEINKFMDSTEFENLVYEAL